MGVILRYKLDDKVRIKMFEDNDYPDHWVNEMLKYCGQVVTIKKVGASYYRLIEYYFSWEDNDFESVVEMDKFDGSEFEI